jgi:polyribonucleotide nucleotidyltransferase
MDFKVAGTADGITSLQMDIKITGITKEIMDTALTQAKDGRNHILAEMAKAIETGRETVNSTAPRIETIQVPVDKIRDVIGSGGKVIREIVEESGAKVDINDDGIVKVASNDTDSLNKALELINSIVAEPEAGEIYEGKVVKIMDFGAFVNFFGKKDGLVHISQLANERVNNVTDVVNEGDIVKVKLVGFDNRGKVKLSMKDVDQKTGKEISSDKLGNNTANDSKPKDDSKPKKEKKPRKKKTEDKKDKE